MKSTSVVLHGFAPAFALLSSLLIANPDPGSSNLHTLPAASIHFAPASGPGLSPGPNYPVTLPLQGSACKAELPLDLASLSAALDFSLPLCASSQLNGIKGQTLQPDSSWQNALFLVKEQRIEAIPQGNHRLILSITDTCGNAFQDTVLFNVDDVEAPRVFCAPNLTATLYPFPWPPFDKYPIDRIYVSRINAGTFDNCSGVKWVKARRLVGPEYFSNLLFYGYDLDGDGLISTNDGMDGDFNGRIDPEEHFTPGPNGKLYTPALPYVDFFCPDIQGDPTVELLVMDHSGNVSSCTSKVTIQDAGRIQLTGPADLEMECDAPGLDLLLAADTFDTEFYKSVTAQFGDLQILSGNECAQMSVDYDLSSDLSCGAGKITRTWTVSKQSPVGILLETVSQTIYLSPVSNFDILFPADVTVEECSPSELAVSETKVQSRSCDTLKVTVEDWVTPFTPRSCDVLYRTFTITNPCAPADACTEYITLDRELPLLKKSVGPKGLYALIRDMDADGIQELYLSADSIPDPEERTQILPKCGNGRFYGFRYTQVINMGDSRAPVIAGAPGYSFPSRLTDCKGRAQIGFRAADNCTEPLSLANVKIGLRSNPNSRIDPRYYDFYWTAQQFGRDSFSLKVDYIPVGSYNLYVAVKDACGNTSAETAIPFEVEDQTGPYPFCQFQRTVTLRSNGEVLMNYWDLLAGKTFDCSGQLVSMPDPANPNRYLVTEFSVNRRGEEPNRYSKSLKFTCDDAGKTIDVEMHAWDKFDNHNYCQARVTVQAGGVVCPETSNARGASPAGLFQDDPAKAGLWVDQNFPNPFQENTELRFFIPQDGQVVLTVRDLHGRVLYRQDAGFTTGFYTIALPVESLPPGVMTYTLEIPSLGQKQTMRMLKLK